MVRFLGSLWPGWKSVVRVYHVAEWILWWHTRCSPGSVAVTGSKCNIYHPMCSVVLSHFRFGATHFVGDSVPESKSLCWAAPISTTTKSLVWDVGSSHLTQARVQYRPLPVPASSNDVCTGQESIHPALVFAVVQLNRVSDLLGSSHTLLRQVTFCL